MTAGHRERKKRQTRAALISAALELCEHRGVAAVTVADIADAAGLSRRTFFNYFTTREEAILGSGSDRAARLASYLAERPLDEPVWDALRATFAAFLADTDEPQREWLARARLVRANPSLLEQQRSDFAEMECRLVAEVSRRTGDAPDATAPRLLVAVAVAAVRVAVNQWIDVPSDVPLASGIDDALVTAGAGFAEAVVPA